MLLLPAFATFCHAQPTGAVVYQHLEDYWRKREFDQLDIYLKRLSSEYPGYVSTTLANILVEALDGSQFEVLANGIERLSEQLDTAMPLVPPTYFDAMKDKKRFALHMAAIFDAKGESADLRKTKYAKEAVDTSTLARDKFKILFTLAPDFALPMTKEEVLGQLQTYRKRPKSASSDCQSAMNSIESEATSIEVKQDAIRTLGGCGDDVISKLCQIAIMPNLDLSVTATEALIGHGEAAVPTLLLLLQDQSILHTQKKLLIWALVRSGSKSPDVQLAIAAAGKENVLLNTYSTLALRFLE